MLFRSLAHRDPEVLRTADLGGVVGEGVLGLGHADQQVILAQLVDELEVLLGLRRKVHAVGAVDLLGNGRHLLLGAHLGLVDELEVGGFLARLDDLLRQLDSALAALAPDLGKREGSAHLGALLLHQCQLGLRVQREAVDGDDDGKPELLDVLDVLLEVGDTRLEGLQVLAAQLGLLSASVLMIN